MSENEPKINPSPLSQPPVASVVKSHSTKSTTCGSTSNHSNNASVSDDASIHITATVVLISVLSGILAVALEYYGYLGNHTLKEDITLVAIVIVCIWMGVMVAVPVTHGWIGAKKQGYSIYQPFVGGETFVFLQIVGWSLYASALLGFGACIYAILMRLPVLGGLLAYAGLGGIAAQLCVLSSIRYFDHRRQSVQLLEGRIALQRSRVRIDKSWSEQIRKDVKAFVVTAIFYQTPFFAAVFLFGPLFLFEMQTCLIMATTFWVLYLPSYVDEPHRNGRRSWPWFRNSSKLFSSFERYFSFKLIVDDEAEFSSKQNYLFGFHPHGIYPLTTFWATRGAQWSKFFPSDFKLDILGASIIFYIPLVRDVLLWSGGRDVTRQSIKKAWQSGTSVMLVPGGEREMRESRPEAEEIKLITRHRGFVRIALQHGSSLVPCFSFGETMVLDNFRAKRVQEYFAKRIFYGMPHLPYGRWYSPIPMPAPITLAIGKPLQLPKIESPSEEQVNHYHQLYYQAVVHLFEKYKSQAPLFEKRTIVLETFGKELHPKVGDVSEADLAEEKDRVAVPSPRHSP